MQYTVIVEKGATSYGASVPDLPGCVAVGETAEEAVELIKKAVNMHLEGMGEDGDPIPVPSPIATIIEVAA